MNTICCTEENCYFCSTSFHGKKHTHTRKFSSELLQFLNMTCGNHCVCRACEVSAKECMKKKNSGAAYKLRWQCQKNCTIPPCSSTANILGHPFSWQDISEATGIVNAEWEPTKQNQPLCTNHYQIVYRHVNATKIHQVFCRICGVKRKHERMSHNKFVLCPERQIVELHLRETVGFDTHINEDDVLCFHCYKYVNKLLKSDICTLSSQNILAELKVKEMKLKEHVEGLSSTHSEDEGESEVHIALCRTALHAYSIVIADRAFLFPDMYNYFLQLLPCDISETLSTSKSRLLTFLGNEFGNLLSSYCRNNKIGTVFHRTKADMHVLLSNALGKPSCSCSHRPDTLSEKLSKSVHALVKHMLGSLPDQSKSLILDVDSFVETVQTVAPDLWEHIRVLTQSVNEHRGRRTALSKNSSTHHLKRLRRAYLLAMILFMSNSKCSFPFHILLADAVESSGASSELITILNRIGAVASVDTLKRVILTVSQDRKEHGIQSLLVAEKFTVASVDNVDFLQSNAAVYCGNQHRSWHATSIQLVQPQPHHPAAIESAASKPPDQADPSSKLRALLSYHSTNSTGAPCHKKHRARTFSEDNCLAGRVAEEVHTPFPRSVIVPLRCESDSTDFSSFQASALENQIADEVKELLLDYFFLKEACCLADGRLLDVKSFCGLCLEKVPTQASNVVYLSIVDMHADSKEAMEAVVSKLHQEYGVGVRSQHLVVVGDQKTYYRLQELKHAYGPDLHWLIPFIGDWHLLLNFHSVLMKVYYDAGLKDLAIASGFRGETLTSLKHCSNFKRTHAFLLQSMEAFYRHFMREFINSSEDKEQLKDLLSSACAHMQECNRACQMDDSPASLKAYIEDFRTHCPDFMEKFQSWLKNSAEKDPNWKFWTQFVFRDIFSYFSLFFSIRSGTWDLRLFGIKQIGPLFAAFDRPHYQKLIPCHLHEILLMPQEVVSCFESGSFVCSVTGSSVHSVALDEAHEMLVNKDLKTTIIRPTKEYVDRNIYYFPVRALAQKLLKRQVLLDDSMQSTGEIRLFDSSPHSARVEENVVAMIAKVESTDLLAVGEPTHPLQSLSAQIATPEQERDLLSFYEVGVQHFKNRVEYFVLRDPSAKVPQRRANLLTFTTNKTVRKKMKMVERERKLVNKCIRRSLAWNARVDRANQLCGGQYLELPRAISDPHGKAHTGAKSYALKWLEKRYKDIVTTTLPCGWIPEVVVLEGMFLIQTSPLSTHQTMDGYSLFLLRRFALPYFVSGSKEVHVVYDNPGRQPKSPKILEQQRRDEMSSLPQNHQHSTFSDELSPPGNWRELLSCRVCKRNLVLYLGNFFVLNAHTILRGRQRFVIAGCFSGNDEDEAQSITSSSKEQIPTLLCDAEEADTRVWLHAMMSGCSRILVCSPDTDVFHIGLPFVNSWEAHVIVQLNIYTSMEHRYLHLQKLCSVLDADPDLSTVPTAARPQLLQSLFICTGCDFTSFFAGIGKTTFMRIAFQYCDFINADTGDLPGCLGHTFERKEEGFLAFIRLVGTAYFAKHRSCFRFTSPRTYFNSLESGDPKVVHKIWLENIRKTIWDRIEFEDELPPSFEALWRHWLRSSWVSHYWSQATKNNYTILDITSFGWKLSDERVEMDWDDQQNISRVSDHVQLLLRGCGCKKGCKTRRCSCLKSGKNCGPGCTCRNCQNVASTAEMEVETTESIEDDERENDEAIRQQYFEEMVDGDDDEEMLEQDGEDSSVEDMNSDEHGFSMLSDF